MGGVAFKAVSGNKSPGPFEQYMRVIAETLNETLEELFGNTIKDVISGYMLQEYGFNVEACHEHPEAFTKALSRVVGETLAITIENLVLKKIRLNLNMKDMDENCSLAEFIDELKRRFK